jgi:sulfur-carrier protein adenylyltransferase/sulfurtransferase
MNNEKLSKQELRRYSRHINLKEIGIDGQIKLKRAKVLIAGLGGLGSPAALYLAAAGIGTIGIIDNDTVSLDNLQRQILYADSEVGMLKVDAAKNRLAGINPCVTINAYKERLTLSNAGDVIRDYDIVLDCTDNFPARYLINDACILAGKPYVYGSVYKFEGRVSIFGVKDNSCYRCLFPEPPEPELIPNCADGGVLGVLPGIIGTLQASEAIKLLLHIGESLISKMLLFDALEMNFRLISLKKDTNCKLCGENPEITELINYELSCKNMDIREQKELTVVELAKLLVENPKIQLIDVREDSEYAEGNLEKAKLIPLGQIESRKPELDDTVTAYMICRSGKRSATAIRLLENSGYKGKLVNITGGMLAWSAEVDPAISVH